MVTCSINGVTLDFVRDFSTNPITHMVFTGNHDANTVVYNPLPVPKVCRFVRLLPVTWYGHISLRMEVYAYGEGPVTVNCSGSNPCMNDATCVNATCNCTSGFAGLFCDTCVPGFWGANCDLDIDECASNPCQANGTCYNGVDSYNCSCNPGYTGTNCDMDVNECASNPCRGGAYCENGPEVNQYTCHCYSGYEGGNCTDIDECASNPCGIGGSCINEVNRYTCTCFDGYIGTNCEWSVNPLGLESGVIPDSSMTASSEYSSAYGARRARLNIAKVGSLGGAWLSRVNNNYQWLQVDLLTPHNITGVATQGSHDRYYHYRRWVPSFKVSCSMYGFSFDIIQDTLYYPTIDKVFTGNRDDTSVVYNPFPVPTVCRFVRLLPMGWYRGIGLRMEIYGEEIPPSDISVDVVCNSTSMTVLVGRNVLGVNSRNDSQIYFQPDDSCRGTYYDSHTISLVTTYNQCGTTIRETDTEFIFSNILTNHSSQTSSAVATRNSVLVVPVHCNLTKEHLLEASEYVPRLGIITFEEEGFGSFSLSLDRYRDSNFSSSSISSGLEAEIGNDMWFAVNLTSLPELGVVLTSCWATPTSNPEDDTQFFLIREKCALDDTVAFFRNLGLKKDGFSVQAFYFIGNFTQVFFHCEAVVGAANITMASRAEGCTSGRGRRSIPYDHMSRPHTLSSSVIILQYPSRKNGNGEKDSLIIRPGVLIGVCIASTIVVIAIILVAVGVKWHFLKRSNKVGDASEQ